MWRRLTQVAGGGSTTTSNNSPSSPPVAVVPSEENLGANLVLGSTEESPCVAEAKPHSFAFQVFWTQTAYAQDCKKGYILKGTYENPTGSSIYYTINDGYQQRTSVGAYFRSAISGNLNIQEIAINVVTKMMIITATYAGDTGNHVHKVFIPINIGINGYSDPGPGSINDKKTPTGNFGFLHDSQNWIVPLANMAAMTPEGFNAGPAYLGLGVNASNGVARHIGIHGDGVNNALPATFGSISMYNDDLLLLLPYITKYRDANKTISIRKTDSASNQNTNSGDNKPITHTVSYDSNVEYYKNPVIVNIDTDIQKSASKPVHLFIFRGGQPSGDTNLPIEPLSDYIPTFSSFVSIDSYEIPAKIIDGRVKNGIKFMYFHIIHNGGVAYDKFHGGTTRYLFYCSDQALLSALQNSFAIGGDDQKGYYIYLDKKMGTVAGNKDEAYPQINDIIKFVDKWEADKGNK